MKAINDRRKELQELKKKVDKSYFSYSDQKDPIIPYDPSLPESMKGNKRAQLNNRDMMKICSHFQNRKASERHSSLEAPSSISQLKNRAYSQIENASLSTQEIKNAMKSM